MSVANENEKFIIIMSNNIQCQSYHLHVPIRRRRVFSSTFSSFIFTSINTVFSCLSFCCWTNQELIALSAFSLTLKYTRYQHEKLVCLKVIHLSFFYYYDYQRCRRRRRYWEIPHLNWITRVIFVQTGN